MNFDTIKSVDFKDIDKTRYGCACSDSVVLTQDKKLLLQHRPENWGQFAGVVNLFGGHLEEGETALECIVREIEEELGAKVHAQDFIFLGAVAEEFTNYTEIVHVHFWHDIEGKITGCYEAEPIIFNSISDALAHPKIMDYASWALIKAKDQGFIN